MTIKTKKCGCQYLISGGNKIKAPCEKHWQEDIDRTIKRMKL